MLHNNLEKDKVATNKPTVRDSAAKLLPVMEHFYTIQGEGYFQGMAAYFIRLAGCDVGCFWCDVKESWHEAGYPVYDALTMLGWVQQAGAERVVITGGEPLLHNLDELTALFQSKHIQTHIETSGSTTVSGKWNWVCLSPKKFKFPQQEILPLANELKIIVYNQSDFAWAETYAKQVSTKCKLYLQPEWSQKDEMLPFIIDYVKRHPQWRISIQAHKYINVP